MIEMANAIANLDEFETCLNMYYIVITFNKGQAIMRGGPNRTGASDRSFYPIFNKKFDHLETLLIIHIPKKDFSAVSLCRPLVPSPQSKCPKRTFMLPQKYHVSASNMLSKPLKCFMENEN